MSYKDEIVEKVPEILEGSDMRNLHDYIETLYERAVDEAKRTGQSIESMTYEILEGLDASYDAYPREIESVMASSPTIMIKVMHHAAVLSLQKSNQKVAQAKRQRTETLEAEKAYLLEALDTLKVYAQENSHAGLQKSLGQTQSDIMAKIHILVDLIEHEAKGEA